MINTILFDFFGSIVSYKHGRQSKSFINAFNYLTKQGAALSYAGFIIKWEQSFNYLEDKHQTDLLEFSLNDVLDHFLIQVKAKPLSLEVQKQFIEIYINEWALHIQPFKGLKTILKELATHYKLVIVTNTHQSGLVKMLLEKYELDCFFQSVISSVDFGKSKPHHDIYNYALKQVNCVTHNAVFVGDSYINDYLTPRELGMKSILIGQQESHNIKQKQSIICITDLTQTIINEC
ncbi:MAG: HAD family hydrolase [Saccharospirillaceae bacterium]|nr:HAD family hydrolase [Pseudomonadales bacterium]NRB77576.1 HAD family hydrolase [Saccharospirillaceae bacterium]